MITITIGKKKYKGVYRWDEITLDRFCTLARIPIPAGYESFIIAESKFSVDKVDSYLEDISKIDTSVFPKYYRDVINCLTDIPVTAEMSEDQVTQTYEFLKPFVISLIYHFPVVDYYGTLIEYQPEEVRRFKVRGDWYYLPESNVIDLFIKLCYQTSYCPSACLR